VACACSGAAWSLDSSRLWLQGELSSPINAEIEFMMLESNGQLACLRLLRHGYRLLPQYVLSRSAASSVMVDELQDLKHLPNVETCIYCPQAFLLSPGVSELRFSL